MTSEQRILHAVRHFGERTETFVPQLVRDVDRLGWQSWVVSEREPRHLEEFPFPPAERRLRPSRLPRPRRLIERAGLPVSRARRARLWRNAAERIQPTVIHAHFGWVAAPAALDSIGAPLVTSFHGTDVRAWPHTSRRHRRLFAELLDSLQWAIASSCSIAGELRALGYAGRLEVIPPGIELERFSFRTPRHRPPEPRLLVVARQVSWKGTDVILRALPSIVGAHPRVSLTVVGDGDELERNRGLARRLGIDRRVTFTGAASHADVRAAMNEADVLVVPSRIDRDGRAEGHPVVPKEAYATGLPVVATTSGGLPEVVPPEQRHELVPVDDAHALALAIDRVLRDPGGWAERARVGRTWVEQQFDAHMLAGRVVALYEEITDHSSCDPGL